VLFHLIPSTSATRTLDWYPIPRKGRKKALPRGAELRVGGKKWMPLPHLDLASSPSSFVSTPNTQALSALGGGTSCLIALEDKRSSLSFFLSHTLSLVCSLALESRRRGEEEKRKKETSESLKEKKRKKLVATLQPIFQSRTVSLSRCSVRLPLSTPKRSVLGSLDAREPATCCVRGERSANELVPGAKRTGTSRRRDKAIRVALSLSYPHQNLLKCSSPRSHFAVDSTRARKIPS